MKSDIRLQKSPLAVAGRAILVIVVLAAWAVAIAGFVRDREPETGTTTANPSIEKKAPAKPYYTFLAATPV